MAFYLFHLVYLTFVQSIYVPLLIFLFAHVLRRHNFGIVFSVCAAMAQVGSVAFGALLIDYLLLPHVAAQYALATALLVLVLGGIVDAIRRRSWSREIAMPIALHFALTMLLIVWTYAPLGTTDPLNTVVSRWVKWLPMDNQLSFYGAEAFSSGRIPIGDQAPNLGDWLFSDRPPLQTALFMLTPGYVLSAGDAWAYNTAAVSLQMLSVLGVWVLVRSVSKSGKVATVAAVTAFLSPITIENGTYVWPKLLAAGFTLGLAALLFGDRRDDRATPMQRGMAIGALASLAMLSHAGTAFAIIGVAVAACCTGQLVQWAENVSAAVTAAGLYLPWAAYQHFINPPGTRLLKWYLADITVPDARSVWQSLVDVYGSTTVDQALVARWVNGKQIFQHYLAVIADSVRLIGASVASDHQTASDLLSSIREMEFYYVIAGTGVLGACVVLAPFTAVFSSALRPLSISIMATLTVWIVFMFQPGAATIHQGAYFTELAIIALGCMSLWALSWRLLVIGAVLHGSLSILQFGL